MAWQFYERKQGHLTVLEEEMKEYGMTINLGKSKIIEINSKEDIEMRITEGRIRKVRKY